MPNDSYGITSLRLTRVNSNRTVTPRGIQEERDFYVCRNLERGCKFLNKSSEVVQIDYSHLSIDCTDRHSPGQEQTPETAPKDFWGVQELIASQSIKRV